MFATLMHIYYFFWFFPSPTAETPAWILTLNKSNDGSCYNETKLHVLEVQIILRGKIMHSE